MLDVTDALCPWNAGRWRLDRRHRAARPASRTDDAADLTLDVRELGAAYLGGTSLTELAGAGRVSGDPAALQAATTAFAHSPAPWCPVVF